MDFPRASTPLCKVHRKEPKLIEQFEVYIAGLELVNAYTEQNDPLEQRRLLGPRNRLNESEDREDYPVDEDFLFALESGMPPAGGVGIGIDRLAMLLTDSASLRDVLLFPLVKPNY
jgi:lysyl-tRNA synthetase class 2